MPGASAQLPAQAAFPCLTFRCLNGSPLLRRTLRRGIIAAAILVAAGCGHQKHSEFPRLALDQEPSLQAQVRLFDEARDHLAKGHPHDAVDLLTSLIDTYPRSPYLLDMRWTLAQAYEQTGDLQSAIGQYRSIIEAEPAAHSEPAALAVRARHRISVLEPNLQLARRRPAELTAVHIPPAWIPPRADLPTWLDALAKTGVTTLVLDVGTTFTPEAGAADAPATEPAAGSRSPSGVYFRTQWATVVEDYFDQIVPLAHEHGLTVFGAVTLRRMGWLEPPVGWADRTYDLQQRTLRPSQSLDLFHPGFQAYLASLLSDLAATGIDGVLFRADAPMGPLDGFSTHALTGFKQSFHIELDPAALFPSVSPGEGSDNSTTSSMAPQVQPQEAYPPEFWRWTGWKARERLRVIGELRREMLRQASVIKFALELHPEAAYDPVAALVHYSEDVLEAKRAGFDYVVTATAGPNVPRRIVAPMTLTNKTKAVESLDPAGRLVELMGSAQQVWIAKPVSAGDVKTLLRKIRPAADRVHFENGIGLLYLWHAPSVS